MIRKLVIALTAVAAFSGAAHAQVLASLDPPRPRLKAEAVVTGDVVRVGDLIANAGIIANVPIFRSPDLGSTGTVSADAVVQAVRQHALLGLDTAGLSEVVVTRATRTIGPDEIERALVAALVKQYSLPTDAEVGLVFDRALPPFYADPSRKDEPRVLRIGYEPHDGRFDATVEIPGRGSLRLTGQARAVVEVATLARPVGRGEIVKASDIVTEKRPRTQVGRDVITKADEIVGFAARNELQAGRLLRATDLMKPEVIHRNDWVTLVYEVPGITLTVRGKAVEGGAQGDTISVLNEQSKRTLEGVVVGPNRVLISRGSPRLAANIAPTAPAPAPAPAPAVKR